ncbi:MAG: TIR domain-containing protein [Coriobacteriales bacterium]|nr:TIR domain-containing protein [Coriobacteriales bacterium]
MCTCLHCESNIVEESVFCPFCGEPTGLCPERSDYEYEAFISYRHLPLSSKVARRMQHDIEGFRIPRELRGEDGKVRLGRLFRDEDELPASTSLSDQIREALARSRFLIVVCTPETRESRWVEREIELFASLHGRDNILVALAEGERSKCLPDVLLYRKVVTANGSVVSEPTEPLAADFRVSSRKSRCDETLRIVAALLGCGFDDLRQRERARRNAFAAKVAIGVTLAITAFLGTALHQQGRIIGQKQQIIDQQEELLGKERELQVNQSRYLAKEADELLAQGDRTQAVQVALAALPQSSTSADRPYVPEARAALERAVRTFPTEDGWYPSFSRGEGAVVDVATCDSLGRYAVLDSMGRLRVYSIDDGKVMDDIDLADVLGDDISPSGAEAWMLDNGAVVVRKDNEVLCVGQGQAEGDSGIAWSFDCDADGLYVNCVDVSEDGSAIALSGSSTEWADDPDFIEKAWIKLLDPRTGEVTGSFDLAEGQDVSNAEAIRLDRTGGWAFVAFGQDAYIIDVESKAVAKAKLANPGCEGVTWTGNRVVVATQDFSQPSPVPYAIQCFDTKGTEVWRTEGGISPMSSNGVAYDGTAGLWARLKGLGDHGECLVASLGGRLVTLDLQDGSQQAVATIDSPIVACQVLDEGDCQRLNVCLASGTLMYLTSDEDGVASGSSIDASVGNVKHASFLRTNDVTYLVAKSSLDESGNDKVSVWELSSTGHLREGADDGSAWSRPADGPEIEESLTKTVARLKDVRLAMQVPESTSAVVQSEGHLLLIDTETGDTLARSLGVYEEAHGCGFAEDGKTFYVQVPIVDDYKGRSCLYVFDLTCGTLAPQSVIPFGVMVSEDGGKVLLDDGSTLRAPTWVMDYPTLDELLERGRELCQGFELSPDEREALFVEAT